jgi:hypothetical protein
VKILNIKVIENTLESSEAASQLITNKW